jgi:anaerobic selenocysteine-containing dehydrogenase
MGLEHGGDASDPVVAHHGSAALLPARQSGRIVHLRAPLIRAADIPLVFKPQTDLIILNAIANHIITTNRVNKEFVTKHTVFKQGQTDIGYGLRPEHPLQQKATGKDNAGAASDISFDQFATFVSAYSLQRAADESAYPSIASKPWPSSTLSQTPRS